MIPASVSVLTRGHKLSSFRRVFNNTKRSRGTNGMLVVRVGLQFFQRTESFGGGGESEGKDRRKCDRNPPHHLFASTPCDKTSPSFFDRPSIVVYD